MTNPLQAYKDENPKESWSYIARKIGISEQLVYQIRSFSPTEVRRITLGTFIKFQKAGINLEDYVQLADLP